VQHSGNPDSQLKNGNNGEHAEILKLHRATRYVPVPSEEIFNPIEEAARQGGLIK